MYNILKDLPFIWFDLLKRPMRRVSLEKGKRGKNEEKKV